MQEMQKSVSKITFINRAANRAAMGLARFIIYPWFIFRRIVGNQTQISTRPS